MEVDVIKGKGKDGGAKGKGKDKGAKGKGGKYVSKVAPATAQCYWCGKYGHYEKECRHKLNGKAKTYVKGAGKTKGKGEKGVNKIEKPATATVECLEPPAEHLESLEAAAEATTALEAQTVAAATAGLPDRL